MILHQESLNISYIGSQAGDNVKILGDLSGRKCRNPGQGQGGQGAEIWSQEEQIKNAQPTLLTGHTK